MENSSKAIGNRTRDLPACSAGPQPTAPQRVPIIIIIIIIIIIEVYSCADSIRSSANFRESTNYVKYTKQILEKRKKIN